MKLRFRHVSMMWASEWSLTAFLVLLAVTVFIIAPLSHLYSSGPPVVSVFFSILLISGMAAVSERKAPTLLVTGLVVVTFLLRWLTHMVPTLAIEPASLISAILCFGLLAGVVILQVFRKGPITGHRIQGAVAVYLMLGMIWAFAYELVVLQAPGAFAPVVLGENHRTMTSNLVYFSYVTLTTIG